jgi:hypothetical protein
MAVMKKPSILVTGAPRSGTTFLGAMLALPNGILEVEEPFNFETGIVGMDRPFLYMPAHSELDAEGERYIELINTLLTGEAWYKQSAIRGEAMSPVHQLARDLFVSRQNVGYKIQSKNPFNGRYVIKDPNACFIAEYMDAYFANETVVIMRHPTATIGSYKRLGWRYDISGLKNQPALMRDFLEPIIGDVQPDKLSAIEEWSYLWLSVYTVLTKCVTRDQKMILITHEELSHYPHECLRRLYEKLGLVYTGRIEEEVEKHTSKENPTDPRGGAVHDLYRNSAAVNGRWKDILDSNEVAIIRRITEPIAHQYYDDYSWR